MAELEVVWSHFAKSQRDEIFKYWKHRNKSNYFSKKLRLTIKSKTEQLKIQPFSGKEIVESSCRILIFGNYSLVYKFTETQIQIVSFWDNRQNPDKLQQILGL